MNRRHAITRPMTDCSWSSRNTSLTLLNALSTFSPSTTLSLSSETVCRWRSLHDLSRTVVLGRRESCGRRDDDDVDGCSDGGGCGWLTGSLAVDWLMCPTTPDRKTTVLLLFWNMSGTTRVSRYQKGKTRKVKTNLDLLQQDSEWQWHLLGYMQVCTSSQTTTPTSHHSVFYRPDALPDAQRTASMHWRHALPCHCGGLHHHNDGFSVAF